VRRLVGRWVARRVGVVGRRRHGPVRRVGPPAGRTALAAGGPGSRARVRRPGERRVGRQVGAARNPQTRFQWRRPGGRGVGWPFGEAKSRPVGAGRPPAAPPAPGRRSGPVRPRSRSRHLRTAVLQHRQERSGAWPRPRTLRDGSVSRRRPRMIPRGWPRRRAVGRHRWAVPHARPHHPGGGRHRRVVPHARSRPPGGECDPRVVPFDRRPARPAAEQRARMPPKGRLAAERGAGMPPQPQGRPAAEPVPRAHPEDRPAAAQGRAAHPQGRRAAEPRPQAHPRDPPAAE
jgi:hypothetical protein